MDNFPQFYQALTTRLGVIGVESNGERGIGIDGFSVEKDVGGLLLFEDYSEWVEDAIRTAVFSEYLKHLFRQNLCNDECVFVGQDFPCVGNCDRAFRYERCAEGAVENGVCLDLLFLKRSQNTLAEELAERAVPFSPKHRLVKHGDLSGELFVGIPEVGLGNLYDARIQFYGGVHEIISGGGGDEFAGVHIECEIDLSAVDAEISGLGVKHTLDGLGRDVLVCVAGDENVRTWGGFEGFSEGVGEIVFIELAEVAEHDDGVGLCGFRLGDRFFEALGGIGGFEGAEGLGHEPVG